MHNLLVLGATMLFAAPTDDVAHAVKAAHEANRAAMAVRGTIRWRSFRGTAPNYEAARAGKWTTRYMADGLYVYDGESRRLDSLFDFQRALAGRTVLSEREYRLPYTSSRHLTNGSVSLSDLMSIGIKDPGSDYEHAVLIDPGTNGFYVHYLLPIDVGRPGESELTRYIDYAEKPDAVLKLEKAEIRRDAPIADLVFRASDRSSTFTIDLEHGSIPTLRVDEYAPGVYPKCWTIQEDIRHVEGRAWLPHRLLYYCDDHRYFEVVIDEARFGEPPTPELLRLEFPTPEPAEDRAARLRYPAQKVWDLAHLPGPNSPGTTAFGPPSDGIAPPAMPGELPEPRSWKWWLIAIGVVLLAFSWRSFSRRR